MQRLKDNFRKGELMASVPAGWFNQVARWLNGMRMYHGEVIRNPDGIVVNPFLVSSLTGGILTCFSFQAQQAGPTGIELEPGDIWLGPLTVIHWADIIDSTTTPAVSATDTCVWLEIDVTADSEAAVMAVGSRSDMEAALTSTEQLTKMVVTLVETTWSDGEITKVKNLHCGDVLIPRAAG